MSPAQSSPPRQVLTGHLEELAERRGVHRAFSAVEFADVDAPGTHRSLTWSGLRARARAVAARLAEVAEPGDRVALVLPQGLDYVAAFYGCLYARVVAVPLFSPELPGHEGRLAAVLADCRPVCLLTDSASAGPVRDFAAEHPAAAVPCVFVDSVDELAQRPEPAEPAGRAPLALAEPEEVAYLQYTSGSTRTPAGVAISHGNVLANARQAIEAYGAGTGSTCVGWLPLFHDMGLVLSVAAPVAGGFPSVLMDPVAFLQQPSRWLRLLSRYPGVVSAAPNFAYEFCASRVSAAEVEELSLERVSALINGSEPVRPSTVARFQEALAPAGLPPEAHCPSYGLAEATVFVCADPNDAPPTSVTVERAALGEGKIVAVDAEDTSAVRLVTCGTPAGQRLRIVDPERGAALPEGEIGEIWLQGPNVSSGYWTRPELTAEAFGARVEGEDPEDGTWLRTGDLGALHQGALLVTGRIKDLLIVDGRNHYPQDIEDTVQNAVATVRRDRAAAFTVPGTAPEESEVVAVVAEHARDHTPSGGDHPAAADAARAAVSAAHGLRLADFRLVPPGSIPRTSSGKVARTACRERYLDGSLV